MQNETDKFLVQKYQSGDIKGLQELVKRWHKTLCNKAYWITKNEEVSKDIAQDTWNTIIYKLNDLNNPNSFGSWALRIVFSKSFDWLRSQQRTRIKLSEYQYSTDKSEEQKVVKTPQKKQLIKAINKLPEQQQIVIRLFYLEEYKLKEISKTLNITIGTAKSRLFYAREKLKEILKNTRNY